MMPFGGKHPLCAVLIVLLAAPSGLAQAPAAPAPVAPGLQQSAAPATPTVPQSAAPTSTVVPTSVAQVPPAANKPGTPLTVTILEGNNSVNSISLLRSVAVAVQIRDSNDFPVEGASVTFTLPAQGPGGTFAQVGVQGAKTFTTRSDARGQAIAPLVVPAGVGKFEIRVTATAGDRKGEAVISQTNSEEAYVGPPLPPRPWYKRKLYWVAAGGIVVAVIAILVVKHETSKSSGPTVVITPGTPVFQ